MSRADDAGQLGVSVTVLGAEEHDSAVTPPQADADNTGKNEATECEEHPMLAHLQSQISDCNGEWTVVEVDLPRI